MGIKDFFLKQALKIKLKDLPETERDRMAVLVGKNPELFKKIGDEVKKRTKSGQSELAATMVVMREYQSEIQKMMRE
jgi:hypothetical protein